MTSRDPLIVDPKVSAESSLQIKLYFLAILLIFFQSGTLPIRFGTHIALVFLFIFFSIKSTFMQYVSVVTSTNAEVTFLTIEEIVVES